MKNKQKQKIQNYPFAASPASQKKKVIKRGTKDIPVHRQ